MPVTGVALDLGDSTIGTIRSGAIAATGGTVHIGDGTMPFTIHGFSAMAGVTAIIITPGFTTTVVIPQLPIEDGLIRIDGLYEAKPIEAMSAQERIVNSEAEAAVLSIEAEAVMTTAEQAGLATEVNSISTEEEMRLYVTIDRLFAVMEINPAQWFVHVIIPTIAGESIVMLGCQMALLKGTQNQWP